MQEQETVLKEYSYTAISGTTYHPVRKNSRWYIVDRACPRTIFDIAYLCKIPEDEVLILKLKYGG